jgi:transcriptional regulator with XRE-family HTH domain
VYTLRKGLGLSQADLAVAAGMHRSYVASMERAERNVSVDNVDRLAIALGVDAQALLAQREA